ncbi:hypothetical protein N7462_005438 [Penicillium macrosclerotiorum]|uniref:uncharacterized protein n=1 Tax=Penicillium macrosclerotiorum TaxID=303699 RepID=UPI002547052D|nr:uncharacterized protein N7462_005438 [Penicillium macrosclerotiorum]KAJ5682273.1 hypothetical protein N7462_005438 [Penicillium macrosclerotiorum]
MAAFLILTGGHEHTHQFISYVGKGKIDTPPEFKISWYPGPEAGAYFEMDRTRGIAEMIPNEDDPMKVGLSVASCMLRSRSHSL